MGGSYLKNENDLQDPNSHNNFYRRRFPDKSILLGHPVQAPTFFSGYIFRWRWRLPDYMHKEMPEYKIS